MDAEDIPGYEKFTLDEVILPEEVGIYFYDVVLYDLEDHLRGFICTVGDKYDIRKRLLFTVYTDLAECPFVHRACERGNTSTDAYKCMCRTQHLHLLISLCNRCKVIQIFA